MSREGDAQIWQQRDLVKQLWFERIMGVFIKIKLRILIIMENFFLMKDLITTKFGSNRLNYYDLPIPRLKIAWIRCIFSLLQLFPSLTKKSLVFGGWWCLEIALFLCLFLVQFPIFQLYSFFFQLCIIREPNDVVCLSPLHWNSYISLIP